MRRPYCRTRTTAGGISIHAPRVGCDPRSGKLRGFVFYFNPRTPCGVRRLSQFLRLACRKFQSTHPVWGATRKCGCQPPSAMISIHAPRVGCDSTPVCWSISKMISIHAPRVGCDAVAIDTDGLDAISIHAPRVGCDLPDTVISPVSVYFNPRTPCGVRRCTSLPNCDDLRFQSTHPVWGATTDLISSTIRPSYFNPRTPCGVRRLFRFISPEMLNFNPRTPCGVRLYSSDSCIYRRKFQSTHPVWGATRILPGLASTCLDFNPRTPCGVRQPPGGPVCATHDFNPRTPCGVRP